MFLTRVQLDLTNRKTQKALFSPGLFHGAIECSFKEKQDRNLWRIDTYSGNTCLLLLSNEIPDMDSFISQYGIKGSVAETKDYNLLLSRLEKDSEWCFRLTANPSHSIKKQKERGKVVAHITEAYQLEWLFSKAENHGFKVHSDTCMVTSSEWKSFYKHDKNRVQFLQASYSGILAITDLELFKQTLIRGIGRNKAYGMGLLTIAGRIK